MAPPLKSGAQVSGMVFRSYRAALEELKILEPVLAKLETTNAGALALLIRPPFPSDWLPATKLGDALIAVESVGGTKATWFCGHHATLKGASPLLMPMISTILAMTGVQPSSLFSRMRMLTSTSLRGFEFV